MVWKKGGNK